MDDLLLLIISSPSGAGKTTLTHRLLRDRKDELMFSVSHTTRQPRPNEVNGQDYHFTDETAFRAAIERGEFAEWAEVHGNLYGTAVSEIARAKEAKKRVLLFDVDYQGARQIRATFPGAIGVFILPPSLTELRRRLESRGTETPESLERRFHKAKEEIEHYSLFDYMIINDDLQQALAELNGIIHAELCRRHRQARRAEQMLRE
ncbi:MAG: guanylate kinase [Myxococcota bacterium]